jgi:Thaumatin family
MQGLPPATVAEWTLEGSGGLDYYDGAVRARGDAFLSGVFRAHKTDGLLTERLCTVQNCVATCCHTNVVSLLDGFNIPMAIIPSANCSVASCPADLNPGCPSQLVGPRDSSGNTVGCKSACNANLDNAGACLSSTSPFYSSSIHSFVRHTPHPPSLPYPGPHTSPHIESQSDVWAFGAQNSRLSQLLHGLARNGSYLPGLRRAILLLLQCVLLTTLPFLNESRSKPIFSNVEGSCPNSYAYMFDQGSGTALWTCNSTLNSDYRLTFCP